MSSQVSAKVIAHSKSSVTGKEIVTFELEFPRIILAEFNTHNALSKNASSSRAIPVDKMLEQVCNNPAMPVRFGAANKGMQDAGEYDSTVVLELGTIYEEGSPEYMWGFAGKICADIANAFHHAGYAKQICNRLIEPFQMMKVVMTATELNNFFWLRDHEAADPTIAALARKIKEAKDNSVPVTLEPGEWHTPYYNDGYWAASTWSKSRESDGGKLRDTFGHTLEHALAISASCCAQVSYRKLDDTFEKAKSVVARLNLQGEEPDQPVHASPLEHQASPVKKYFVDYTGCSNTINGLYPETWQEGITHMDRDGTLCSGNFKGWIQHRQLVPNHVKRG